MQRTRVRFVAAAAVVVVAAAIPAVGLAGQPVVRDHESVVEGPFPSSFCGIDGMEIDTGTFTYRQDASGLFHATESFSNVFTSIRMTSQISALGRFARAVATAIS